MNRSLPTALLAGAVALLLCACVQAPSPASDDQQDLLKGRWTAADYLVPALFGEQDSVTFSANGSVIGNNGCEQYSADYVADASGSLRVSEIVTDTALCSFPWEHGVGGFGDEIATNMSFTLPSEDSLVLTSATGRQFSFERAPLRVSDLRGNWVVTGWSDAEGEATVTSSDMNGYLGIDDDGVSGFDGCNGLGFSPDEGVVFGILDKEFPIEFESSTDKGCMAAGPSDLSRISGFSSRFKDVVSNGTEAHFDGDKLVVTGPSTTATLVSHEPESPE